MPFVPVVNTTEVHIRYTIEGVNCENVIHYLWPSGTPPTEAVLAQLALDTWTTIAVKIAAIMHAGCFMTEVYARNIHTEFAAQSTYTPTAPLQGSRTGLRHPNQIAKSLIKRTGFTGRSKHGGMRLSGLDVGMVLNNAVTPAFVAALANLIASLLAARGGGTLLPALASRVAGSSTVIRSMLIKQPIVGSTDTRTPVP